jgi:hypothetical protein
LSLLLSNETVKPSFFKANTPENSFHNKMTAKFPANYIPPAYYQEPEDTYSTRYLEEKPKNNYVKMEHDLERLFTKKIETGVSSHSHLYHINGDSTTDTKTPISKVSNGMSKSMSKASSSQKRTHLPGSF